MSVPSHEPGAPRDSTFTAAFLMLATLIGCTVVVLTMPRPVEPTNLPPLVLDASAVAAQRAEDEALARSAPGGGDVEQMYTGFLQEGRAERSGTAGTVGLAERRAEFRLLSGRVFARVGERGARALRARATERFLQALMGKLPAGPEVEGLLGEFPGLMQRYQLVDDELTIVAPETTLRAMYKARWNIIHHRPPLDGLSKLDLQAYEGWNALHATALAPARRLEAARVFREAGGRHAAEAYAIWLYRLRSLADAEKLYTRARAEDDSLRLRNELMAVWRAQR